MIAAVRASRHDPLVALKLIYLMFVTLLGWMLVGAENRGTAFDQGVQGQRTCGVPERGTRC